MVHNKVIYSQQGKFIIYGTVGRRAYVIKSVNLRLEKDGYLFVSMLRILGQKLFSNFGPNPVR